MTTRFKFYKDRKGTWRWSLVARNGRIVADCAEGFKTQYNAKRNARVLIKLFEKREIESPE